MEEKVDWARRREQKLQKIRELFPSKKVAVEKGLGEGIGHVLVDRNGRVVTDKDGWIMFWFNEAKAEKDARYLSKRLGVNLRVRGNSWKLWMGYQISSVSRIEV